MSSTEEANSKQYTDITLYWRLFTDFKNVLSCTRQTFRSISTLRQPCIPRISMNMNICFERSITLKFHVYDICRNLLI